MPDGTSESDAKLVFLPGEFIKFYVNMQRRRIVRRRCVAAKPVLCSLFRAFCLMTLAASCGQVRSVGIETYNPAGVTFPENVRRVLVVNNAAVRAEVPFTSTVRKLPESAGLTGDSAVTVFCHTLGREIAASPRFEDVLLYDGCYRTDSAPSDGYLTPDDVTRLCEEHAVDAVISLDRLLFHIRESIREISWIDKVCEVEVGVSGVLRVRLPDRETPLTTLYLSDTIRPQPEDGSPAGVYFMPQPDEVLSETAAHVAVKAHAHFVPYRSADSRWYYVSPGSRWKEAAAFAAADKWEQAATIWQSLYETTNSWKTKACLASNLALCTEFSGRLAPALQWAILAHQYFSEHLSAGDRKIDMQKLYVTVLEHRVAEEKTLRKQLGNNAP
jgi:hypothetical protein